MSNILLGLGLGHAACDDAGRRRLAGGCGVGRRTIEPDFEGVVSSALLGMQQSLGL
jgi:hypothetical protein